MNKYFYLLKNVGILTLASIGTKFLSFLMAPIYTSILSTADYGTYELFTTTINLLIPVLTLNLHEALLRYCIDNNYSKKELLSITMKFFTFGTAILTCFVIVNSFFAIFTSLSQYTIEFAFLYFFTALTGILTCFARGCDKLKVVAISGMIGALTSVILNVIFLCVVNIGIKGYLWANVLGLLGQSIYLLIRTDALSYISLLSLSEKTEKQMISYSIPLIFNSLAWWINSASDRYVVTFFCGVDSNGIYSIAYKIPSLLSMMNSIFNQAWILSAVKEYDTDDSNSFFFNTYTTYNTVMVFVCSVLIMFSKFLAWILFKNQFYSSYVFSPLLLVSVVFGAMSGYLGGILSSVEDTKTTAYTVGVGAIINLVLNIILVRNYGTIGAAIATVISYILVFYIRLFIISKRIQIKVPIKKDAFIYLLLIFQAGCMAFDLNDIFLYSMELSLFLIVAFMCRSNIGKIYSKFVLLLRRSH